jgi:uncharacterized phage protein (TIGR01671 family)
MREIKFRGYQPQLKKWVYGNLISKPNGATFIFDYKDNFEDRIEVDPETVGQFTGQSDKNKKDIYEHDKVSDGKFIYKVAWDRNNTRFYLEAINVINSESILDVFLGIENHPLGNGYFSRKDLEIVGNIHEKTTV